MKFLARRRFLAVVTGALAGLRFPRRLGASTRVTPPSEQQEDDSGGRELAAALRQLNDSVPIGITPEEFDQVESYATGVYRDVVRKLRPIVLDDRLGLAIHFSYRNKS